VWNNTSGTGAPALDLKFVYDLSAGPAGGWNVLAILDSALSLQSSFAWGLDLSGTMDGAGGVGALLSTTVHTGPNAGTYFYAYDGNGNVMGLINAADGSVAARYEYGPFGELLRATGPMAKANPFRFSTKYQDEETDFIYYGGRYYIPSTGRWLSRDPAEERGGVNLYSALRNDPGSWIDPLGLDTISVSFPMTGQSRGYTYRSPTGSTVDIPGDSISATISGKVSADCLNGKPVNVAIGPFSGRVDSILGNSVTFYVWVGLATFRVQEQYNFAFSAGAQTTKSSDRCTGITAPWTVDWTSTGTLSVGPNIPGPIKVPFPVWITLFTQSNDIGTAKFTVNIICCCDRKSPAFLIQY
jgi:RHS repeat-associated protein